MLLTGRSIKKNRRHGNFGKRSGGSKNVLKESVIIAGRSFLFRT
jgi:hypothetical protein